MDKHYQTLKIGAAAMLGFALVFCPNLLVATHTDRLGLALGCFSVSIPVLGFVVATIYFAEVEAIREPEVAVSRLKRFDTLISFATITGAILTVLGLWFSFQYYSIEHGFAFIASTFFLALLWIVWPQRPHIPLRRDFWYRILA